MTKLRKLRILRHALGENGITLIEVLAAMIVLAVGILAMGPMFVISISGSRFSNEVTSVAAEAQEKIEDKIGLGTFPTMPYTETETVDNGKYTVTTEVRDETVDASIPSRVYQIEVTVQWKDDVDVDRSMAFVTYGTKR
jgi:type II secretory pathway pseudopilin PulG